MDTVLYSEGALHNCSKKPCYLPSIQQRAFIDMTSGEYTAGRTLGDVVRKTDMLEVNDLRIDIFCHGRPKEVAVDALDSP